MSSVLLQDVINIIIAKLDFKTMGQVAKTCWTLRQLIHTKNLDRFLIRELDKKESLQSAIQFSTRAFPAATALRFKKSAKLAEGWAWNGLTPELLKSISQAMKRLTVLEIDAEKPDDHKQVDDVSLIEFARSHPKLRVLKLQGISGVSPEGILEVLKALPQLRVLKIRNHNQVTPDVANKILELKKLNTLTLTASTRALGEAKEQLVEAKITKKSFQWLR